MSMVIEKILEMARYTMQALRNGAVKEYLMRIIGIDLRERVLIMGAVRSERHICISRLVLIHSR